MLQMNSIWNMIFDLLFIGLLTAIVEEFLFRGACKPYLSAGLKISMRPFG